VPYPIQSGSITDRLRRFFRIRGKTGFQLDEIVVPTVLVQDLTLGPYQAGVTPAAGEARLLTSLGNLWSFAIIMNDKLGSLTPRLGAQFKDRTFSFTWAEIVNIDVPASEMASLFLRLSTRADVLAAGIPSASSQLISIQSNDGSLKVPVEIFEFGATDIPGAQIWRGLLGDNTQTLGSRRTFEIVKPNITIGPDDALVFTTQNATAVGGESVQINVRGFYQEQPA